jgi:hypothetical protein
MSEFTIAFFQLFNSVEAKLISIRLAVHDTYERDYPGRVMIP